MDAAPTLRAFDAIADAHVRSDLPTTNEGTSDKLSVDGSPLKHVLLRFDVSGITGTVTDVHLRLFLTNVSPKGGSVHRISNTTWGETTVTWDTRPAIDGPVIGSFGSVQTLNQWYEVSIGAAVTGDGLVSLALDSTDSDGTTWASRETVAVPQLIVYDDPTPPTVTTLSFTPSADTYVRADQPATIFGAATKIYVDADPIKQSFLRFDVAGIAGTVTDVRLRLNLDGISPQGGRVYAITDTTWDESSVTYDSKPAIDGALLASFGSVQTVGQNYEVTLGTPIATDGTLSLAMDSNNGDGASWLSRETPAPPRLLVDVATESSGSPSPSPSPSDSTSPSPSPSESPSESPAPSPTPSTPASETLTFLSSIDASVKASSPTTNYGNAAKIELDGSPLERTFMRFDVTGIGADRVVTAVKLTMKNLNGSKAGGRVFWITNLSWGESTITWNNQPPIDGQILRGFNSVSPNNTYTLDLGLALTGDAQLSLALDSPSTDGADWSSGETAEPPQLLVSVGPPVPPPSADPSPYPVIAAAGDIACDPLDAEFNGGAGTAFGCQQGRTSDLLVAGDYDAVLMLGDGQYEDSTLANYNAVYDPTWGRVKGVTYPVPGNHEYHVTGASGYFSYFGSAAGNPNKGYYSVDVGDWHVIALNTSSACAQIPCGAGSTQEQWLRADLAAHTNTCTLAFMHYPRFSSQGDRSATTALFKALYDGGADLLLTGHDHVYERFPHLNPSRQPDANGVREFIVGGGGEDWNEAAPPGAQSQASNNWTFGVLEMTLRPTGYDWNYLPIAGQTYTDSGSGDCH